VAARLRGFVADELEVDVSEIDLLRADPANGQRQILPGKILRIQAATRGHLLGRAVFRISMIDGRGQAFSQWVRADIEQLRKVLVAKKTLRRHQVLTQGDLVIAEIRIRHSKNGYETQAKHVIGKRLTRPLRKGQPILSRFLEEAPMIHRGEQVTITLQAGGLQIITLGRAKEDGQLRQLIKVMNLDSKKVVLAEVVRPGDVRLGFVR